jgi:hypothetical protein
MPFLNFWYGFVDSLKSITPVLIIAAAFAGIIVTLYISIFRLGKKHQNLAIIFSTIVSCVLMVPVITSFNNLVVLRIEGAIIDEGKAEIRAQIAEVEKLKAENKIKSLEREKLDNEITIAKQSIEIEALNADNILLERAKLSMQSFQQVAELALAQANFSQTLVRKEPVTPIETGWGLKADFYYDEALVIIAHDINAKFGVDLKEVKIAKAKDNSVVVSGIRPRFIGANQNESKTLVKEIRRVDNKFGVPYRVRIKDQRQDTILAGIKADQYELEFQKKLSEGMEMAFMDNAIVQLAQNFIKIVLAPLYNDIVFNNTEAPEALPLLDYLAKEINENNEEKYRLLRMNEQFVLKIDQLETELENSETGNGM